MDPIKIHVAGAKATVLEAPVLTAGMVGLPVVFTFDAAWDGLIRNAIFRANNVTRTERNIDLAATVDKEVMTQENAVLKIGVMGLTRDGREAIPTVWADIDHILESVAGVFQESVKPDNPLWMDVLERMEALETIDVAYYRSVSDAVSDVCSGSAENALQDASGAVVQVFIGEDGRTKLELLSDTAASAAINIDVDLDLILNGKVLTLTDPAAVITFAQGTSCTIDGTVPGSKIFFDGVASTSNYNAITVNGSSLTVLGGEYELICNISGMPSLFKATPTCESFLLEGVAATVENSNAASAGTKFIQSQVTKLCTIRNSKISVTHSNTKGQAIAYMGTGAAAFENCTITCTGYTAVGLDDYGNAVLKGTTVTATGQKTSYGARNYSNTLTIESSKIVADAPGDDADEESSLGIFNNSGTCIIRDSEVFGTLAGVQNHGILYVEGGIFTGYSHGGFYFSHGSAGLACVNDATIRCGNYEGAFSDVFAGDTVAPLGGFYVGGTTAAKKSGMTIYMDGCQIGEPGYRAFVVRNSGGEANNTVNISNSTMVEGAYAGRIDSGTGHLVNLGIGASLTTENAAQTVTTGELYRKKHPDAECTGKDYAAIVSFMNANTNG